MPTLLRRPDEIYRHELGHICTPHRSDIMLRDALHGRPFPQPHFYSHLLDFLARHYHAPAHLMDDAFAELQRDLERGRILLVDRWVLWPAFFWIPAQDDDKEGRWVFGHVYPEHKPIL